MTTRAAWMLLLLVVIANAAVGLGQGDLIRANRVADWIFIVTCQQVIICLIALGLIRFAEGRAITRKEQLIAISLVYIGRTIYEAIEWIQSLTQEPEVGKIYNARVVKLMDFGVFIETIPGGLGGLVHISQLGEGRTEKVTDEVNLDDEIKVKLMEVDDRGRLNFSKKAADHAK